MQKTFALLMKDQWKVLWGDACTLRQDYSGPFQVSKLYCCKMSHKLRCHIASLNKLLFYKVWGTCEKASTCWPCWLWSPSYMKFDDKVKMIYTKEEVQRYCVFIVSGDQVTHILLHLFMFTTMHQVVHHLSQWDWSIILWSVPVISQLCNYSHFLYVYHFNHKLQ